MAAIPEFSFITGSQGCGFATLTEELVTPHGCRADCVGAYFHVDTAEPSLFVECTRHRTVVDARQFSRAKAGALAKAAMRTAILVDGLASVEQEYTDTPVTFDYAAVRVRDFTHVCRTPGCGRRFLSQNSMDKHAIHISEFRPFDDIFWREGSIK